MPRQGRRRAASTRGEGGWWLGEAFCFACVVLEGDLFFFCGGVDHPFVWGICFLCLHFFCSNRALRFSRRLDDKWEASFCP